MHYYPTADAYIRSTIALDEHAPETLFTMAKSDGNRHDLGRGNTYFFRYQEQDFVFRHYQRGGLLGRVITDSYLYLGLQQTRAWREFDLLARLFAANLPVPEPIAIRIQRRGILYHADLITRRIANSESLSTRLKQQKISPEIWQKIGATIAQMHALNVYHTDLNAHNILIDSSDNIWLIDFDKCYQRQLSQQQKQANLQRLHRSFSKIQAPFYQPSDFDELQRGYAKTT